MERYYNFAQLSEGATEAVRKVASEANLEVGHPLIAYAFLEACATAFGNMRTYGTPLSTAVGRDAGQAYLGSLIARKVEELKSPHSSIVNYAMDAVVYALINDEELTFHPKEALDSAIEYLIQGGVIEREADGHLVLKPFDFASW